MCNTVMPDGSPGREEDCPGPYFPQYHTWFGKGVTRWVAVLASTRLFVRSILHLSQRKLSRVAFVTSFVLQGQEL